jgi:hypothetical protein
MTPKDLDDAIDRAVRDIMSAEPRPGLRGRVLGRLERRAAGAWRFAFPTVASALALALVAFAVIQRRPATPTQPSPSTTVATRPAPSVAAPTAPLSEPPSTSPAVTPRVSAPTVHRVAPGLVQAASVDDESVVPVVDDAQLPPLNEVVPLSVGLLPDTRLQTRDISIGELSLPPIAVEPLPLPGGGSVYPREDR